jgi:hypothetical protein
LISLPLLAAATIAFVVAVRSMPDVRLAETPSRERGRRREGSGSPDTRDAVPTLDSARPRSSVDRARPS